MIDIKRYKNPLIVAGHGIRLSNAIPLFYKLIDKLQIPVVTTFNSFDIMPSDHPLYIGRIGTIGTPEGNKALRETDCVVFLGTRNNIRQISYNWKNFAINAFKINVDIDQAELNKKTIKYDKTYNMDVKNFMEEWYESL